MFKNIILHVILDFQINQAQFTAAVTEECVSAAADYDPDFDDDLDADLLQECQSCSLATGGSQSKREELMIINQCNRKRIYTHFHALHIIIIIICMHAGDQDNGSAAVMMNYLMALIFPFITLRIVLQY